MKKFLFPAIAALALVGCSSDKLGDEPVVSNDNLYIPVAIAASDSRDVTDYDYGTDDENKADAGVFLFFDANGNQTQAPQTLALTAWANGTEGDIAKVTTLCVNAGNAVPNQVMVILNAPNEAFEGLSLSQVAAKIGDYDAAEAGKFIMSNSVFGENVKTTPIAATDFHKDTHSAAEAAANGNAVKIYVERVVAKVAATFAADFKNDVQTHKIIDENGKMSDIKVKVNVKGLNVANVSPEAYLVKDIANFTASKYQASNGHRSWWANTPAQKLTDKVLKQPEARTWYENVAWNAITSGEKVNKVFYVQENTTSQPSAIMIAAQLTDESGNALDIVKYGNIIYDANVMLTRYAAILKNNGVVKKAATETEAAEYYQASDLRYLNANEHLAAVENAEIDAWETYAVANDGNEAVANCLKKDLYRVWKYTNGMTYYYVNINHHLAAPENVGVVRNHVYQLNLKSIAGLGVPVVIEGETIVPKTPEDEVFNVDCQINILKWAVVKQDIDFGKN